MNFDGYGRSWPTLSYSRTPLKKPGKLKTNPKSEQPVSNLNKGQDYTASFSTSMELPSIINCVLGITIHTDQYHKDAFSKTCNAKFQGTGWSVDKLSALVFGRFERRHQLSWQVSMVFLSLYLCKFLDNTSIRKQTFPSRSFLAHHRQPIIRRYV
jgi:hypothetical protein